MIRRQENREVVAILDVSACPVGSVLGPLDEPTPAEAAAFEGWEAPLVPRGGFNLPSGLEVVVDVDGVGDADRIGNADRKVLAFSRTYDERALVTLSPDARDYAMTASILPLQIEARPHNDRADCTEALAGLVFRVVDSRHYYEFGIEGRRNLVLYRRADDEWYPLHQQAIDPPLGYVELNVELAGDGIRCACPDLGHTVFVTDTTYRQGRAGIRALGCANVARLEITQTPSQRAGTARLAEARRRRERELGQSIADPVLVHTMPLGAESGVPQFIDFAEPGRYDMLLGTEAGLRAASIDGDTLWTVPERIDSIVPSKEHTGEGRLLYGLAGVRRTHRLLSNMGAPLEWVIHDEIVVIRGRDGAILARTKVPAIPEIAVRLQLSLTTAHLSGEGAYDIVLREWRDDVGHGGFNVWTYNRDLELLWHRLVRTPYGHDTSIQFCDVNGCGYDEVLAGGTLFDREGNVLWEHDLAGEMAWIRGAQHYDSTAIGYLSQDKAKDPVAFLLGGSAGLYIVDALTGRTRMAHRIGHAQGRHIGRVRDDYDGQQVLVACRWGNMGILTLFSGSGERLWRIQPDYIGQGAVTLPWGDYPLEVIWTNTTAKAQAFYDGYGRRVKELAPIRDLLAGRQRRDFRTFVARLGSDPQPNLIVTMDGTLYAFGPAD